MDRVEHLTAIEAIRMLKARYFRAIDTKDESLLHSLFAENAIATLPVLLRIRAPV